MTGRRLERAPTLAPQQPAGMPQTGTSGSGCVSQGPSDGLWNGEVAPLTPASSETATISTSERLSAQCFGVSVVPLDSALFAVGIHP